MRYFPSTIAVLCLALLFSACSNTMEPLDEDPLIEGTVTQIDTEDDRGFRFLVEKNPSVNDPLALEGKKIWFYVDEESTLIKTTENGSLRRVDISAIRVDQTVRGWVRGAVADSYPQQAIIKQITILD